MRAAILLFFILSVNRAGAFEFPKVDGWQTGQDMENYNSDNLFEYINGAAESYLSFGFQELNVAEYRAGGASVLVEVYRHASPEDAFGIYTQERPREGPFKSVGYQGYQSGEIFCFVAADYYIKIIGSRIKSDLAGVLERFAVILAKQIPENTKSPGILVVFPPDNLRQNSEAYIARNFLGYDFFRRAFTADYPGFRLFVLDAGSSDEVREILMNYTRKLEVPLPEDRSALLKVNDPHHGRIIFSWEGKYLWGGFEIKDGPVEEYVNTLGKRVKSYDAGMK